MPGCGMSPSPAISFDVSTTTTRLFRSSARTRATSRSIVVLPTPGRPRNKMLFPDSTMSRMISTVPYTARPTRSVRPTTFPARLRSALMRWSVRSIPARLSPPNCPMCEMTYARSSADTSRCDRYSSRPAKRASGRRPRSITISRRPSSPSSARTRCARSGESPRSSASSSSLCCIHPRAYRGRLSIPPVRAQAGERPVTLDTEDRDGIAKLGVVRRSAGYDAKRIRPMLRADSDSLTPRPSDVPIIARLLPKGAPLATLLRLFLLSLPVPLADARAALSPLTVEHSLRLGIVRRSPGGLESTVRLLPAGDLVIACDRSSESAPDLAADHVMGVASSSVFLASLTVRRPIERALDIGCGNGIQAVLAARHAQRVVACDVNPRALNFTLFNGSLNGVENIECRGGSFFEPVAGETFDLIVSNPPFVISPDNAIAFRDGGLGGDAVTRRVVREAPAYL